MYKIVDDYCHRSKNLYNYANKILKDSYNNEDKYILYPDLWKMLKDAPEFKEIGSNSGQHTLKMLDKNWQSYFEAVKSWNRNKSKFLGEPNLPKNLEEKSRFVFVLTNVQSKINNGYLKFSFKPLKPFNSLFRTKITNKHLQTRFIPRRLHYIMEIVFEVEIPINSNNESRRIIGIDLGVNNFTTIQNNFYEKPFCINGRGLKAINNYYNKKITEHGKAAKKVNNVKWTKLMDTITNKRKNKVENFLHHASKYIVNYCIALRVDTVVIGYNQKWKQNVKLGKSTQQFVYVPYYEFIKKLEYKLESKGIKLIQTEESYTSKASFIDNDNMEGGEFSGRRIQRGMYESSNGKLINADVNGAGNIIRKVFPNAFEDGIKGVDFHPTIINVI